MSHQPPQSITIQAIKKRPNPTTQNHRLPQNRIVQIEKSFNRHGPTFRAHSWSTCDTCTWLVKCTRGRARTHASRIFFGSRPRIFGSSRITPAAARWTLQELAGVFIIFGRRGDGRPHLALVSLAGRNWARGTRTAEVWAAICGWLVFVVCVF